VTTPTALAEPPQRRKFVVVANRLPVRKVEQDDGDTWVPSPGGLVSALEPAVRSSDTTWVGWSGLSGTAVEPFVNEGISLHPVDISAEEEDAFYGGFSNSTLWPLYHDALFVPQFRESWWDAYVAVNQRYAHTAASVAAPGATVWIHDYQLQLVPAMLRELRSDVRIGFFLHIPFPSQELYLRIPWRVEIYKGILGADLIGFQTAIDAENFRLVAKRLIGVRSVGKVIIHGGRTTRVGTFPVGIDSARVSRIAGEAATIERARAIRAELGDPKTVLLGVDRMDYTKGIEVRLQAYRELLEEGRVDPEECVLVQIAQPSRDHVPGYAETLAIVEQIVGGINGDFGRMGGPTVKYLHQGQSLHEIVALYCAADIMLVTPFRDGMNLVAKEYVASRRDRSGVLILSEFAGAAHQLHRAILVNPFDVNGLKDAIANAVNGDRVDQRRRMSALVRVVRHWNAERWANDFLRELEAV
jgi:trehalose 6-phosphate synthase